MGVIMGGDIHMKFLREKIEVYRVTGAGPTKIFQPKATVYIATGVDPAKEFLATFQVPVSEKWNL